MFSDSELASLEKHVQYWAECIIRTFRTAPAPTKPLCAVMIAPLLDTFQSYVQIIAKKRSASTASTIRTSYGTLLNALVKFANSTWTVGERVAFERCNCKRHSADSFQNFYREISELRDTRREYGTLREIVIQVFLILTSVATDIRDNDGEIIKLEKNRKHGKWPSSPSQFIPHGPAAAVSAFIEWAQLAEHPAPLNALCQIASCSSSLLSAMNNEGTLLPLLNTLITQHISWLRQLDFINISACGVSTVEQGIKNFLNIFRSDWFHNQMVFAQSTQTNADALTPLYHEVCAFIPLLKTMAFRLVNGESMGAAFGVTALAIRSSLSTFDPVLLHPVLIPFVAIRNQISSPYIAMMDAVVLRNQQKCAETRCLLTGESTKSNFKQCAGCRAVRYCSKECQVVDWKQHKHVCKLLKVVMPIALSQYHKKSGMVTPEMADDFWDKIRHAGMTEQEVARVCRYTNDHTGVIINQCQTSGEYMLP